MDKMSFLIFTDEQTEETKDSIYKLVREVADADKDNADKFILRWFTANGASGIEGQMRPSFKLENKLKKPDVELELMDPEKDNIGPYSMGWVCNGCSKQGPASEANYRHRETQYDLCKVCYEKVMALTGEEEVDEPKMFVLDFKGMKFYKPEEGKSAVTKENIAALIKGVQDKTIAHEALMM